MVSMRTMCRLKSIFGYFILTIILSACAANFADEQGIKDYVLDEDNGLVKSRKIGDFSSKLTYRPSDLFIAQELDGITSDKDSSYAQNVNQLLNKYKDYYYFVWEVSYSTDQGEHEALYTTGREGFSEVLQRLSFRMHEYANLTSSANDTIPVADAIFPRTYGMGSASTILMVYAKKNLDPEAKWISININELGLGLGDQKFRFSVEHMEDVPRLKRLKRFLNN